MIDSKGTSFEDEFCLLVEDQSATLDFLKGIVAEAFPGIKLLCFSSLREVQIWIASRECEKQPKDRLKIALVDLGLPDGSGIDVLKHLSAVEPNAQSVVITIYDDDAYLFEALAAGASGYLLKADDRLFLLEALRRFETGQPPLSPAIARRLLGYFRTVETVLPTEGELSSRERETLTLLAKGMTVPEAAVQMKLSPQTVAGYVKIIYQKLHVTNRVEAVREAIRRGWV